MNYELPDLHPAQNEVARACDLYRFVLVSAGRRFGKTFLALVIAVYRALLGQHVLWVAPTHKVSNKGWVGAEEMLRGVPGVTFRAVDREIRFAGGGRIQYASADAFNRGDGGFHFAVLDEAAYLTEVFWTAVVRPMLADRGGGALFISSPSGSGTWYHRMFLRGQEPGTDTKSFQFGSAVNPYLPAGEVEAARNDPGTPSRVFRAEWEGAFCSAEGARVQREWLRIEHPPALDELSIAQGLDTALGEKSANDFSACVTCGKDSAGVVWVLGADRVKASFHALSQWIVKCAETWAPKSIAIEQAGPSGAATITELQRTTGLPIRGVIPKGSKLERFSASVEGRIENGLIKFAPTLPEWFLTELCEFGADPLHDDGVDALVYSHGALTADTWASKWGAALDRVRDEMHGGGLSGDTGYQLHLLQTGRRR